MALTFCGGGGGGGGALRTSNIFTNQFSLDAFRPAAARGAAPSLKRPSRRSLDLAASASGSGDNKGPTDWDAAWARFKGTVQGGMPQVESRSTTATEPPR
jgi:hypothetical protein